MKKSRLISAASIIFMIILSLSVTSAAYITAIDFAEGSSTDFSLATAMQFPMVLESLDSLEVEVVFSPSVVGPLNADLEIFSIDNSLQIVVVSLQGGTGQPPSGACAPSR